jgi:hypothetical protein
MMSLWEWALVQRGIRIPADTEAIDVTSTLRYFYECDQEWWNIRNDFPNIAPPFRSFFMFGSPLSDEGDEGLELGVWFLSERLDDGRFIVSGTLCGGRCPSYRWEGVRWLWRVSACGGFLAATDEGEAEGKGELQMGRGQAREYGGILWPYLLATSMMHCKNVTARRVVLSRQQRRARERCGLPVFSYSVLDIAPMRATLRVSGGESNLRRALHICRGHFKDYREGAGLFGTHKGLYWWQQSLRGNGPRVHDKTYRLPVGDRG